MRFTRRSLLSSAALSLGLSVPLSSGIRSAAPRRRPPVGGATPDSRTRPFGAFDPRLDILSSALRHNARQVSRLAENRPILAVVKNNAYGLGLGMAGPILDESPEIAGLAVVKVEAALALRAAGVSKPILLMARAGDAAAEELVRADIRLAPFGDGALGQLERLASRVGRRIPVHLYLDTGMGRLGTPFRRALPWIRDIAASPSARIEGTFMGFTEEDDFDPIQLTRLLDIAESARREGIDLGRLHAASSHGLFFRQSALLDMVRPGLVLFGAYPSGAHGVGVTDLQSAVRLSAGVARVERLEAGDSVSYGRNYVAAQPTWVATIPVGHADGYPRRAVEGCEALIGQTTYRVIGAVSASHTIVELGPDKTVEVGEEAILVGPDHPSVHPNTVAERAGVSVYDVLMHLSSRLPRRVV